MSRRFQRALRSKRFSQSSRYDRACRDPERTIGVLVSPGHDSEDCAGHRWANGSVGWTVLHALRSTTATTNKYFMMGSWLWWLKRMTVSMPYGTPCTMVRARVAPISTRVTVETLQP